MKKTNKLLLSLISLGALGLIGVGTASACGWFGSSAIINPDQFAENQKNMFQNQADVLGISVDKVKEYWAQGKNLKDIANDLGISEQNLRDKMKQLRSNEHKQQLQILVDRGIITQDQANKRLELMNSNPSGKKYGKGMMRGLGFGMWR